MEEKLVKNIMAIRMPSSVNPKEKIVKICVVGPKGCGKSSVTRAMVDWNPKTMRYTPTAGVRQVSSTPRYFCICKKCIFLMLSAIPTNDVHKYCNLT